jgi:hypothetical protein
VGVGGIGASRAAARAPGDKAGPVGHAPELLGGGPRAAGEVGQRPKGAILSMESGKALAFALWNIQERGKLFNRGVVLREFLPIVERGSDIRVVLGVGIDGVENVLDFRCEPVGAVQRGSEPRDRVVGAGAHARLRARGGQRRHSWIEGAGARAMWAAGD